MPTNNNGEKKVMVNGKEADPVKKKKLPVGVDWQALVLEKQKAKPE